MLIHVNNFSRCFPRENRTSGEVSALHPATDVFIQPSPSHHHHHHHQLRPALSSQQELGHSQQWVLRESHIFWQAGRDSDIVFPVLSPSSFVSPSSHLTSLLNLYCFYLSLLSLAVNRHSLSVAEETHSILASRLWTAHWTHLCRSNRTGEAPLLPSFHQQLHRMTNDSEKRTEEEKEKTNAQKAVPKLENVPRVRNSLQTKAPLYSCWHCRSCEITQTGDKWDNTICCRALELWHYWQADTGFTVLYWVFCCSSH